MFLLFSVLRDRNPFLLTPKKLKMKTLNDLFGKKASFTNFSDFNQFSISQSKMNAIKGGTQPILSEPGTTPPPPTGNNNI
jgi:hypothetical protein